MREGTQNIETNLQVNSSNYRRFLVGTVVSVIGDALFDTTILLWVALDVFRNDPRGPAAIGVLVCVGVLPSVMFGAVLGTVADRISVRNAMVAASLAQAGAVAVVLALVYARGSFEPVIVFAAVLLAVFVSNGFASLYMSCRIKLVQQIVPRDGLPKAFSMIQGTSSLASIIGPPLAAPVLLSIGPSVAFLIDVASFVISALLLIRLKGLPVSVPSRGNSSFGAELRAGASFVWRNQMVRSLVVLVCAVGIGTAPLVVLVVYYLPEQLHHTPSATGLVEGFFGCGVAVGSFGGAVALRRFHAPKVLVSMLAVIGLMIVLLSVVSMFAIVCALFIVIGFSMGVTNASMGPFILEHIPPNLLGRVMGVVNPSQHVSNLVSNLLFGLAASALGVGFSVQIAGISFGRTGILFLAAGIVILVSLLTAGRSLLRVSVGKSS